MNVYAYLSIAEAAFKLGIAYILFSIPSERLIVYGLLSLSYPAHNVVHSIILDA